MTTTLEKLTKVMEQLMYEHSAATQFAVGQALARAFSAAGQEKRDKLTSTPRSERRNRRSADEIIALSEKLYEVVCKKPGETMAVLAAELNATSAELQMPMRRLRNDEHVRSIGTSYNTRYFPLPR